MLIMLLAGLWAMGITRAGSADGLAPSAATPALINYQGLIEVDAQPYQGTSYFKFAIVDAATGMGQLTTGPTMARPVANRPAEPPPPVEEAAKKHDQSQADPHRKGRVPQCIGRGLPGSSPDKLDCSGE
jgi:hypothetical protein